MGTYLVGQVCLNGHPVTGDVHSGLAQPFCSECGAKTITNCQCCGAAIHGKYHEPGIVLFGSFEPDSYCYNCGQPYPWTEAALRNTALLIQEEEDFSDAFK